jgi:hypothetical protein
MRRLQTQWLVLVAAVAFAVLAASPLAAQKGKGKKATTIRGRVVKVQGTDRFVVRTTDNREVILRTRTATKFLRNNRPIRFADVRVGSDVAVLVDEVGDDIFATSVTIGEAIAPDDATLLEGTIVRVDDVGNRVIVRTPARKEVILFTEKDTVFTLDNRAVRLVELRPGMAVKAKYKLKDKKHMAHSIVVTPRPRK